MWNRVRGRTVAPAIVSGLLLAGLVAVPAAVDAIEAGGSRCVDTDAGPDEVVFATVTATQGAAAGFVNAHNPDVGGLSNSTQNFQPNQSIANTTVIVPDDAGEICVTVNQQSQVIVDVIAYASREVVRPASTTGQADRVLDTRVGGGKLVERSTRCARTDATGGERVFATVTATEGEAAGFINGHTPGVNGLQNSTQNFQPNQSIANTTLIVPDSNGEICVTANKSVHAVVDVVAYIDGSAVRAATASGQADRVLDSRTLPVKLDGGPICIFTGANPNEVVYATVTATEADAAGFINAHSRGVDGTANSTQNFQPVQSIANTTLVKADGGSNGEICITLNKPSHVVVDVAAYGPPDSIRPATSNGQADRVLDTRNESSPPPPAAPPANPGDTRNCSDFATYADAKAWFDTYFPFYGDIAR
ncbi:MAG: hypothetical protein AAFY28_02460, partial [Actinomycetota bacterium]